MNSLALFVLILGLSTPAFAQAVDCTPREAAVTSSMAPPTDYDTLSLVNPEGTLILGPMKATSGAVTLSETQLLSWKTQSQDNVSSRLLWTGESGKRCIQQVARGSSGDGLKVPPNVRNSASRPASEDCTATGQAWLADITKSDPKRDVTVIVLRGSNACYRSDLRKPAAHGDPIHVGILTDQESLWIGATTTFTPCDIEPAAPNVQQSDKLPTGAFTSARWVLLPSLPRQCWNDAVTISVKGVTENVQAGMVLQQYPRYRATVHLGALRTELHERQFGLRPDGTQKKIFSKGPEGDGPEYTASLVFYSVFRYLGSLGSGNAYKGREIRNENKLIDRIGFSVGVGLKSPLKRFIVGGTFELISGVNVFAGTDFADVPTLKGVEEDQPFTGEEAAIPTQRQWRSKGVVGLTFDLAYATKLFK